MRTKHNFEKLAKRKRDTIATLEIESRNKIKAMFGKSTVRYRLLYNQRRDIAYVARYNIYDNCIGIIDIEDLTLDGNMTLFTTLMKDELHYASKFKRSRHHKDGSKD